MEKKETTIYSRKIPTNLHRQIKAAAALQGKSLDQWVVEALREKLEREGKL